MKKGIIRFLKDQKRDWQEFAIEIGLKTIAQQIAIGAVAGFFLLLACGLAEWLESQY